MSKVWGNSGMIISEKQIMQLMQNTPTLLAIGDSSFLNYRSTVKGIREVAPKIINLLNTIKNQQSEDLREISDD